MASEALKKLIHLFSVLAESKRVNFAAELSLPTPSTLKKIMGSNVSVCSSYSFCTLGWFDAAFKIGNMAYVALLINTIVEGSDSNEILYNLLCTGTTIVNQVATMIIRTCKMEEDEWSVLTNGWTTLLTV